MTTSKVAIACGQVPDYNEFMDEKSNLFVFAKKEVALIFMFMLFIAVSAFILGVKVGKNYSFQNSGYSAEDRAKVELMSGQEEQVDKVMQKKGVVTQADKERFRDQMNEKLEAKISEELSEKPKEVAKEPAVEKKTEMTTEPVEQAPAQKPVEAKNADPLSGKYTIQLGSHRSIEEAEKFAEGFKIRGYNPIITEVALESKGTWYRVSIGVFDSVAEAKDFVKKEESLFQGQDFVFAKFE